MRWTGLFGAFSCVATGSRSSLLCYGWQGRQDLNLQPSALETDALPLSYSPKELDDLAVQNCGYSSTVVAERGRVPLLLERGNCVPRRSLVWAGRAPSRYHLGARAVGPHVQCNGRGLLVEPTGPAAGPAYGPGHAARAPARGPAGGRVRNSR